MKRKLVGSLIFSSILVLAQAATVEKLPTLPAITREPAATGLEFDSDKPWSGTAEFTFLSTVGNTDNLNLGFKSAVKRNWARWALLVRGEYLRNSDQENLTAESYLFGARGTRKFTDYDLFTDFEYQSNLFAGFSDLYKIGLGIGHEFWKTETNTLRLELGPAFVIEKRVVGPNGSFGSMGLQALHKWKIADHVELGNRLSYLVNLSELKDSRYELESTLTAPISGMFSLKAGYLAQYRNDPPVGKKNFDGKTTLSVLATF